MTEISLGPGPVVFSLTDWTENSISAIIQATSQAQLDSAFDAFIAKDAHITVNGKHVSRAQYKERFQSEKSTESSANVSFTGAVEVPKDENHPTNAGSVGLLYKATVFGKLFVFGSRTASTINSSLNVVIVEEHPGGQFNLGSSRRVTVLNEVVTDQVDPVVPPHSTPATKA
ncbi:hypothetical protein AcW1_002025 [Taiwanofungus camphoratus]|nr:hypothetical protein AcV5_010022 [Antrodia cinnamomea]KAI0944274.1 hypothetical protein AcW1_002025 [Antrodia cinnamomea]KAI0945917.1 hypothetical protein AcV7_010031 [Antrodia cinnamomea]